MNAFIGMVGDGSMDTFRFIRIIRGIIVIHHHDRCFHYIPAVQLDKVCMLVVFISVFFHTHETSLHFYGGHSLRRDGTRIKPANVLLIVQYAKEYRSLATRPYVMLIYRITISFEWFSTSVKCNDCYLVLFERFMIYQGTYQTEEP